MAEVSHDFIGSANEGVPPSLLPAPRQCRQQRRRPGEACLHRSALGASKTLNVLAPDASVPLTIKRLLD